ncbi:hypothetical protein N7501_005090 [Penicillium viridicatum]|nr:hypothetical protein N7501_005090 [Penicillium viridicatum]
MRETGCICLAKGEYAGEMGAKSAKKSRNRKLANSLIKRYPDPGCVEFDVQPAKTVKGQYDVKR